MITEENVLNAYMFGSRVYRTHHAYSDNDYVFIVKEYQPAPNTDTHVYTVEQFQSLIDNHDIQALECLFLNPAFVIKENHSFTFNLDKQKLRPAISTITSNSWVKGKKKLTVMGDYDLNAGVKSVFHSLRILDFGIQIAQHGKIINYESMNWVLEDLWKLSEEFKYLDLWNAIDTKYRSLYNAKSSEFKRLAPKDLTEVDKRSKVMTVLLKHGVQKNTELVNELLTLF